MNLIYLYGLIAVAVYNGIGLILVLALRNQEMMVKRQLPVVVLKTVLLFIISAYYILSIIRFYYFDDSLEDDFLPCYGRLIIDYIASTVWMFSFILRAAHLFAVYKFQHLKLNANTKNQTQMTFTLAASEDNGNQSQAQKSKESKEPAKESKSMEAMNGLSMHVLNMLFSMLSLSSFLFNKILGRNVTRGTTQTVTRTDIPIMLLWVTLLNVVVIVLIVLVDWKGLHLDPWQAGCYPGDLIIIYCYIIGFISLVPPFLIALHKVKDSLYIRVELTASICIFTGAFVVYLSDAFLSKPYMSRYVPLAVAACMINILTTYFPCFIQIYRLTRTLEPNCTAEYLDSVLAKPAMKKRFLRLAAKQLVIENVYFLIDYQNMLKGIDSVENVTAMFDKYLGPQAPYELNIPFNIKSPVVKAKEKGELNIDHFEKVSKLVKGMLVTNTLQSFINQEHGGS